MGKRKHLVFRHVEGVSLQLNDMTECVILPNMYFRKERRERQLAGVKDHEVNAKSDYSLAYSELVYCNGIC